MGILKVAEFPKLTLKHGSGRERLIQTRLIRSST